MSTVNLETIKSKLKKIAALAERGIGGEKENAKRLLETLLTKHGLTIDDIQPHVERQKKRCVFKYRTKQEKQLLFQCYYRAANVANLSYYRAGRNAVGLDLDKLEEAEMRSLYAHFLPLWRKEMQRLEHAFFWKHDLTSHCARDDNEKPDPISPKEYDALVSLMRGLQTTHYVSTRRQLTA